MRLEKVSKTTRSLALSSRVEAKTCYSRVDAARARRDLAVTLEQSVKYGHLARLNSTESLRFLHLAHANTRRLTLVRCCIVEV
jgi:hypothetical protein